MAQNEKRDPFAEIEKLHLLHEAQLLALVATFEQSGAIDTGHYKANVLALSETMRTTPNADVAEGLAAFSGRIASRAPSLPKAPARK